MSNQVYEFSSSHQVMVYDRLNEQAYDPQSYTRDSAPQCFKYVARSMSGLTGSVITNGPGVMVVPVLDRHHNLTEADRTNLEFAAIRTADGNIPISIRKVGGNIYINRESSSKVPKCYRIPRYWHDNEEEPEFFNVTTQLGMYDTTTVLLHLVGDALMHPDVADEFCMRAVGAVEVRDRYFRVERLPGMPGCIENYVLGLEITEDDYRQRYKSSKFMFEGAEYQFHRTKHPTEYCDAYAVRCLYRRKISEPVVVKWTDFESASYDFRELCRELKRSITVEDLDE